MSGTMVNKIKAYSDLFRVENSLTGLIGVVIGAFSAALMDTKSLVLFFSLIIYLLALNLIFLKDKTKLKIKFNLIQRTTFGFVVGFISSLMGIGGAIMNVPILKFVGYTINKAIGTAASIGFLFLSLASFFSFSKPPLFFSPFLSSPPCHQVLMQQVVFW